MAEGCCMERSDVCIEQVFVLAGQSNMSGRGGVQKKYHEDGSTYEEWDRIVPPECKAERGTIWSLNAKLDWVKACEPLHTDIDKVGTPCGVGPGLVFAASLLRQWKEEDKEAGPAIGLVPCAVYGTKIKEWEKGSKLYEQMIERAKFATSKSSCGLKAVLWYQGESDTNFAENVKEYPQRLESLITDIRADLQNSKLPIIQVGITAKNHPRREFLEAVRRAQRAVNIPGVYYVDADGLPLMEDDNHLSAQAQVQLGKMLAEVYMSKKCGHIDNV